MANICVYKAIVKGKKDACYAFYWSMSVLDGISIKEKGGSDDDYMIRFEGDCKWTVDQYCQIRMDTQELGSDNQVMINIFMEVQEGFSEADNGHVGSSHPQMHISLGHAGTTYTHKFDIRI